MKFRWKLLILLLILAMLPVLVLRTFGARHLQMLSTELVTRLRNCRQANVEARLHTLARSYAMRLQANIRQAETLLNLQAVEIRRCLQRRKTPAPKGKAPGTYRAPPFSAAGAASADKYPSKAAYGKCRPQIIEVYGLLHSPFSLRQVTVFTDGTLICRPALSATAAVHDPRTMNWYRNALSTGRLQWSSPLTDVQSGRQVLVASRPVSGPAGRPVGVTAAVIPLLRLFEKCELFRQVLPQTSIFIVRFAGNATTGLEILAQGKYSGKTAVKCLHAGIGQRLVSADSTRFEAMLSNLRQGRVSLQYMPYESQHSLWTAVPAMQNIALILVTPTHVILEPAKKTEYFVAQFMQRQFRFSLALLLATLAAVVIVAVFFARTVTRPLQILVESAHRLAGGNFAARADISTRDEFTDLAEVFNGLGPKLRRISRMEQALAVAADVQENLLPQNDPQIEGLEVSGTSIYCDKIGGDYFDYLTFSEQSADKFGVVIADVSDHGIASALLMATARALLHERASLPGCASCDLAEINRQLCADVGNSGRFMTLFYAEFDLSAETIRWVRAGHDPVLVYDPDSDRFDELDGRGGIPLGILPHAHWAETVRGMHTGQIFVFATDGIWETRNAQGEFFGKKRLRRLIRENAGQEPHAIRDTVMHAVETFRGPLKTEDDLTLVIVKYSGMSSRSQT